MRCQRRALRFRVSAAAPSRPLGGARVRSSTGGSGGSLPGAFPQPPPVARGLRRRRREGHRDTSGRRHLGGLAAPGPRRRHPGICRQPQASPGPSPSIVVREAAAPGFHRRRAAVPAVARAAGVDAVPAGSLRRRSQPGASPEPVHRRRQEGRRDSLRRRRLGGWRRPGPRASTPGGSAAGIQPPRRRLPARDEMPPPRPTALAAVGRQALWTRSEGSPLGVLPAFSEDP